LELVELVAGVKLPPGYGFLADQMRRAAASTALNFAEGNGKGSVAERRRFFRIAKGSAFEVAAAFDVALRFGVIEAQPCARAQDICDHIGALLYRYR
jgi:four helix bundle protein